MKSRLVLGALAVAMFAATGTLVNVPPAAAASNLCGGEFRLVGTHADPETGPRRGTVEVYWDGDRNCAITWGVGEYYGRVTEKSVALRKSGRSYWHTHDHGDYKYYAGPVTLPYEFSEGCIDIWASVAGKDTVLTGVHCGA